MNQDASGQRIEDLFHRALELPADSRSAFLAAECAGEPLLRERVERLLAADAHCYTGDEATPSDAGEPTTAADRVLGQIPKQAPRFELGPEIARGGMGSIIEVYDRSIRRRLAMKVVLSASDDESSRGATPRLLDRFVEEAQITGQLDHPSIVPIHELGVDESGRAYFTMPLIHGLHLGQVLERHREGAEEWSQPRVLDVLLRVCDAVAFAHSKGVVHRDLKPANIMVGQHGEVYVMDWGLAQVANHEATTESTSADPATGTTVQTDRRSQTPADSPMLTGAGEILGTPAYMSPEQAVGDQAAIGPRSDVYALGAILYHLLRGHAPFVKPGERPTAIVVRDRVLSAQAESLAGLAPPELIAICEKALSRSPANRYAGPSDLASDLRAFLDRRVVSAYRTGPARELWSWVRRNRALAIAACLSFLALAGGLTASLWQFEEAQTARASAEAHLAKFDQLSLVVKLENARSKTEELWPAWPRNQARIDRWLTEADSLQAALPKLQRTIDSLAQGPPQTATRGASDDFLRATLDRLVTDVEIFLATEVTDLRTRAAWASRVEQLTIGTYQDRWAAARAAILAADGTTAHADYGAGSLTLTPQMGLVPIGMNPVTKLWEFYHLRSAWDAERGADPGTLSIPRHRADGSVDMVGEGIVFVLIPGGRFWMGAQDADPNAPNYDPEAGGGAGPVHEVTLTPYFLSKFELSSAQWARLNRGQLHRQFDAEDQKRKRRVGEAADRVPVIYASWTESARLLSQHGLLLPTEAQWERACRAGTDTPWHCGDDASELSEFANVRTERRSQRWRALSPLGSFRPNAFGLYDMAGNAWEWCRDQASSYDDPWRAGDGLREVGARESKLRVRRGGSYRSPAIRARSSNRNLGAKDLRNAVIGLRPARAIHP